MSESADVVLGVAQGAASGCRRATAAAAQGRARRWGSRCALAGFSILVTLVALDLWLRAAPQCVPLIALRELPAYGAWLYRDGTRWDRYEAPYGYRHRAHLSMASYVPIDLILLDRVDPWRIPLGDRQWPRLIFRTDARGFVNARAVDRAELIGLGDSFTGAISDTPQDNWVVYLGEALGMSAYNLGVHGYGPQQASLVLRDFGLPLQPRTVVWMVFRGNDLEDAAGFAEAQSGVSPWSDEAERREVAGVTWAQASPLCAVLRTAWRLMSASLQVHAPTSSGAESPFNPVTLTMRSGDRMTLAFLDEYLKRLLADADAIRGHAGFAGLVSSLHEMAARCRAVGARLVIAVAPTKAEVYLEALWRAAQADAGIAQRLAAYLKERAPHVPGDGMALLRQMREQRRSFADAITVEADSLGVRTIDLAAAFQDAAERGQRPYYPYDTHWTAEGHALAARVIAEAVGQADRSQAAVQQEEVACALKM